MLQSFLCRLHTAELQQSLQSGWELPDQRSHAAPDCGVQSTLVQLCQQMLTVEYLSSGIQLIGLSTLVEE